MTRFLISAAFGALLLTPLAATAQEQDSPGQFDFFVLSLSWSPSFCAAAAERGRRRAANAQCGVRPYSFVVHGLWPQYEKGFPEYCQLPAPRLDRSIVASMLDLMPARHLIFNEWNRHGTCSGQTPRAYFETVRKARAAVKTHLNMLISKSHSALRGAMSKTHSSTPIPVWRQTRLRSVAPASA